MIRRNRSEKIKQVDKICCCVLLTSIFLKKFLADQHLYCSKKEAVRVLDLIEKDYGSVNSAKEFSLFAKARL